MEETIIIYTKYFSEAVIEVLDRYDLNIQVMCFSSYDKVYEHLIKTPNLRGLIFLEHKPPNRTFKAYKKILEVADEIAESSKQPFCVSIISNTDKPRKFLSQISTNYLDIFFTKFVMFNTDLLRFEGLAQVIVSTIGVANETILLELEKEEISIRSTPSSSKLEFMRYCLQITTVDKSELTNFDEAVSRFPELEKLIYVRTSDDKDEEFLQSTKSIFNLFVQQCITRREQDERKYSFTY